MRLTVEVLEELGAKPEPGNRWRLLTGDTPLVFDRIGDGWFVHGACVVTVAQAIGQACLHARFGGERAIQQKLRTLINAKVDYEGFGK